MTTTYCLSHGPHGLWWLSDGIMPGAVYCGHLDSRYNLPALLARPEQSTLAELWHAVWAEQEKHLPCLTCDGAKVDGLCPKCGAI